MAASSGLFLATIYNQSQLAERKHVARYWSINTAATAVPLSAHPSPIEVAATKLTAVILGGGGGCSEEVFCRLSTAPVVLPRRPHIPPERLSEPVGEPRFIYANSPRVND